MKVLFLLSLLAYIVLTETTGHRFHPFVQDNVQPYFGKTFRARSMHDHSYRPIYTEESINLKLDFVRIESRNRRLA